MEGDEPDAVTDLRDPDLLAGKDLTEIDLPTVEARNELSPMCPEWTMKGWWT